MRSAGQRQEGEVASLKRLNTELLRRLKRLSPLVRLPAQKIQSTEEDCMEEDDRAEKQVPEDVEGVTQYEDGPSVGGEVPHSVGLSRRAEDMAVGDRDTEGEAPRGIPGAEARRSGKQPAGRRLQRPRVSGPYGGPGADPVPDSDAPSGGPTGPDEPGRLIARLRRMLAAAEAEERDRLAREERPQELEQGQGQPPAAATGQPGGQQASAGAAPAGRGQGGTAAAHALPPPPRPQAPGTAPRTWRDVIAPGATTRAAAAVGGSKGSAAGRRGGKAPGAAAAGATAGGSGSGVEVMNSPYSQYFAAELLADYPLVYPYPCAPPPGCVVYEGLLFPDGCEPSPSELLQDALEENSFADVDVGTFSAHFLMFLAISTLHAHGVPAEVPPLARKPA
ncbi:hypothetical protein GPECTOR_43g900 [Gonium pectorale]|uniref:Uncharacterized protein n=1 Tax=Gonium pectorale TaxID=33097 RepID=A0A150G9E2_GONPE|nr:hypothetical protein GPECTOR_43g900 [Gonium pectorale]|eukprot:KXZ46464.1 hypothetical protein GPECTOR_43g900 [Gonium pectorale]